MHTQTSFHRVLEQNSIFLAWSMALQVLSNPLTSHRLTESIVNMDKHQAKEMLKFMTTMNEEEDQKCKNRANMAI